MRLKCYGTLGLLVLVLGTAGCGQFVARRMAQSPNTYPKLFGGMARTQLAFDQNLLTNFPPRTLVVGPPKAQLSYRIVEPGDFQVEVTSTNWLKRGREHSSFSFRTRSPGVTNAWTASPRGTVLLLHGYGLAEFAMVPWALRLAEEGWRCVLVDLRGHGKSTGRRIYYGVLETHDLGQLLDELERAEQTSGPVAIIGESYGASLALRLKSVDRRIGSVVAIAPYGELTDVVLNICDEYADWLPKGLVKSGLKKLPVLLKVEAAELDTTTVLDRTPVAALFVAGGGDRIAPVIDVRKLFGRAAPGSEMVVVAGASHEAVPYHFDELLPSVLAWLNERNGSLRAEVGNRQPY